MVIVTSQTAGSVAFASNHAASTATLFSMEMQTRSGHQLDHAVVLWR
jgi:hypothetical protein